MAGVGRRRTRAQWRELPRKYPSYQTCHRRFQQWRRTGLLRDVLERLAEDLRDRGTLDLTEGFIRRGVQFREKRGSTIGPTKRGKGSTITAIGDGHGLPLALHLASASPAEVTLVDATLEDRFLADRLIGDKAQ